MSYSIHIARQTAEGQNTPISLDEWNAFIEADPDLQRPEPGHPNYSDTLALLPSNEAPPEDWPWLAWSSGSISSDYPQPPMLKKIGQAARHFGAIVLSDDGDVWTIDENGKVSMSMEGY